MQCCFNPEQFHEEAQQSLLGVNVLLRRALNHICLEPLELTQKIVC